MTWFPIGPDFVFGPKNQTFKRLSVRNEFGRQGLVSSITVDPTDPLTLYVAERPSSGGSSAFRTRDDGRTWTPIADSLQQADANVDPSCFAVNPDHPQTIYMGTWSKSVVYVSNSRGDPGTWSAFGIPANVRKLIVDPRTSANLATTVLYAAAGQGVLRSADGGANWTQVLAGDVWTLVASIPTTGTAHFYAGVWQKGVFHTTDPTTAWTNLNTQGIGLPAHTAATTIQPNGNFDAVFVDYCRGNPNRVYAWLIVRSCNAVGASCDEVTAGIYTTSSPTTGWTQVASASPPGPGQGLYAWSFAVAPNSPGNGTNDILMFGSLGMQRSIDGGQTWQNDVTWFHADQHSMAFSPEIPAAGVVPATYIGNDGGIGKSSVFADPTVSISTAPADYNEGFNTANTFAWQNRNHGKQSSAIYQYSADPAIAALSYIGCQDTGIGAGDSSLGWRGIADADGGALAVAAGPNGVNLWASLGYFGGWAGFRILHFLDKGEFAPAWNWGLVGTSVIAGTSNYVKGLDGNCLAGGVVHDVDTTLSAAIIGGPAPQAATPASMANVAVGRAVTMDSGTAPEETVWPSATTATTFTAVFQNSHAVGSAVSPHRSFVLRIDGSGAGVKISQDFNGEGNIRIIGVHPTDANFLYCATNSQKVWRTNTGSTASPATVWTEMATGRPLGLNITGLAITTGGLAYVLLSQPLSSGATTTPLFEVSTGTWLPQSCSGLPTGFSYGKLVADPVQANTLYAAYGAKLCRLTLAAGIWTWTDISGGLPGQWIYDLWIGKIGSAAAPRVLLRAAIPTRGVFEQDVTAGAVDPPIFLYLRDNFLDQARLANSPDGALNPYNPVPSDLVFHYQSADIKIDARQNRPVTGALDFFQTDPEGNPVPPLNHTLFDQLQDNSQNLPQTDAAKVHVQVHNRSYSAAGGVSVWAIYCRAASPLPLLSQSPSQGNAFPFWSQFSAAGAITPNLPADSPWKSVGSPQVIPAVDVGNPQVASWDWVIPPLQSGDPGHYCMAAFVQSATDGVGESMRMQIDDIAPSNRHVGQKNVHIGPPLPPAPIAPPPGGGGGGGGVMEEYLEFHNPSPATTNADFLFDLRGLPQELGVTVRLSKIGTVSPRVQSATGVADQRPLPVDRRWTAGAPKTLLGRIIGFVKRLFCELGNIARALLGRHRRPCGPPPGPPFPEFEPLIYEAQPSALMELRGITLPPFGFCAALIRIETKGNLEPGSKYRFNVQKRVREAALGGNTYVVTIDGDPKLNRPLVAPSHDPDLPQRERDRLREGGELGRFIPPGAEQLIQDREAEQHKE